MSGARLAPRRVGDAAERRSVFAERLTQLMLVLAMLALFALAGAGSNRAEPAAQSGSEPVFGWPI